ncbi:MAG: hypothetical protein M5R42_12840 [Rhodocyclaceae bacterium]|nr:hypothetical protein [Rhodocyclaceae bacterium]
MLADRAVHVVVAMNVGKGAHCHGTELRSQFGLSLVASGLGCRRYQHHGAYTAPARQPARRPRAVLFGCA